MAEVGNVTSFIIKSVDATENEYETTITNKNVYVNPNATYQQVDAIARALNAVSYNTYQDTNLITKVSVNEKLAEE